MKSKIHDRKFLFPVHMRQMKERDLPQVLDIEEESFEFPWRIEDFTECLEKGIVGMVAEDYPNQIMGFMLYGLQKKAIDLLNLAVSPDHWRKGIGTQMIRRLKSEFYEGAVRGAVHRLRVQISEKNLRGQLFFRENGFIALDVIKRNYQDYSDEDAYLIEYRIGEILNESTRLSYGRRV